MLVFIPVLAWLFLDETITWKFELQRRRPLQVSCDLQ
jgi:hypothetical protein